MKRVFIHTLYLAETLAIAITVSLFFSFFPSDGSDLRGLPIVADDPSISSTAPSQQIVGPARKETVLELFGDDPEQPLRIVDFKSLSRGEMLVSVNDTMYLLNAKKEVVWETYVDMVAPPIVDSSGTIFGIASDLAQFSVNAKTGKVSYFGRHVGGTHSYYTQIKPYKGNQYLIVENKQFYRDGNLCYPKCPMSNDALYGWSGQRLLWSTEFPPNAELQVWENKIFAVTKRETSVILEEIELPRN